MSVTLSGILVFGVHPDDGEFHAGGLLSLDRELDFAVKIISVTNGAADPYHSAGDVLARRRLAEAQAASALLGSVFEVWDYPDMQRYTGQILRVIATEGLDVLHYHYSRRWSSMAVPACSFHWVRINER